MIIFYTYRRKNILLWILKRKYNLDFTECIATPGRSKELDISCSRCDHFRKTESNLANEIKNLIVTVLLVTYITTQVALLRDVNGPSCPGLIL